MRFCPKKWEKAKALYFKGMSWEAIGNQLQCKPATLSNKAHREGLTAIKREAKNVSPLKQNSDIETLSNLVRQRLANDALQTLERVDNYCIAELSEESKREQVIASVAKRSALVFGWEESQQSAQVNINLLSAMPDKKAIDI